MQLYIMRHGEAQDFNAQSDWNDSQRALSKRGEVEVKLTASWFEKMKIKPKHIFVSPYVRAQQTCSIVASTMDTTITTLDFITPLDDAKPVHDYIDGWLIELKENTHHHLITAEPNLSVMEGEHEESVLIISHMPLVCFLVAELTQPSNTPIFATAGVAHIDYDIEKMQGILKGMFSP